MVKKKPWLHGSVTYRRQLIETQERQAGFFARMVFMSATFETNVPASTARIAEDYLIQALSRLEKED